MVSLPPRGMASRAFTARFMTTCSICPGSALTRPRPASSAAFKLMSSPKRRVSSLSMLPTTLLRSNTFGDHFEALDAALILKNRATAEAHSDDLAVFALPGRLDILNAPGQVRFDQTITFFGVQINVAPQVQSEHLFGAVITQHVH